MNATLSGYMVAHVRSSSCTPRLQPSAGHNGILKGVWLVGKLYQALINFFVHFLFLLSLAVLTVFAKISTALTFAIIMLVAFAAFSAFAGF